MVARTATKIAYVRGFDVYVYDLASGKESAVTIGGTAIKTHGLAEFVAQEEMGRHSGFWWSPDGKHIAYEEADHTGVETWYVADPLKPDQKPRGAVLPAAGQEERRGEARYRAGDRRRDGVGGVGSEEMGVSGRGEVGQDRAAHDPGPGPEAAGIRVAESRPDNWQDGTIAWHRLIAAWINLNQDMPKWYDEKHFLWISDKDGDARLALVDLNLTSAERVRPDFTEQVFRSLASATFINWTESDRKWPVDAGNHGQPHKQAMALFDRSERVRTMLGERRSGFSLW